MAIIKAVTERDFLAAVEANCNPTTHIVVTDGVGIVWVVPVVTSQHRHYIIFESCDDAKIKEVLENLKSRGYKVITGFVDLRST